MTLLKKLRTDSALAMEFSRQPEVIMKRLGVDISNLKISEFPMSRGPIAPNITICASIGFIVCATVGDDV